MIILCHVLVFSDVFAATSQILLFRRLSHFMCLEGDKKEAVSAGEITSQNKSHTVCLQNIVFNIHYMKSALSKTSTGLTFLACVIIDSDG